MLNGRKRRQMLSNRIGITRTLAMVASSKVVSDRRGIRHPHCASSGIRKTV
jgi:hypothetical protein